MALDLTGQTFGRWTVLARGPKGSRNQRRRWTCRCECGVEREVQTSNLTGSLSTSCGCARADGVRQACATHALSDSPLHRLWRNIRKRCNTPTCKSYPNYGGRGIQMCAEWNDFACFLSDMGPTYQPGLTIERVDNNGNYEPHNCIWIPKSQQSKNRRPYSEWKRHEVSFGSGGLQR